MANAISPPDLFQKVVLKYPIHRAFDITIFFLLASLLVYRLLYLSNHGFAWVLALLCESCFTFIWVVTVNCKWNPVEYKTYPERLSQKYFSGELILTGSCNSLEFQQEHNKMKDEYEELASKIKDAVEKSMEWDLIGDFAIFSNMERKNHPTIIKTRVSGLMTNAPFMLNVDCDMFVNNPQMFLHAMCLLLGSKNERESGFVQCPQYFYDGLKDDPFGNQLVVEHKYLGKGAAGIQGPFYGGTGCFHRRKVIYGSCPDDVGNQAKRLTPVHGGLSYKEQLRIFGDSKEFLRSAAHALQGKEDIRPKNLPTLVEAAHQVAGCGYEYGTSWGTEVGWQYGSATEDVLTGLMIHARGWRSLFCTPDPRAFLGCAPRGGPISMTQQKRWATCLLEILISRRSPIVATATARLQFRQCLMYLPFLTWGLRSVPELCYAVLPAYCTITNSRFLPEVHEPAMYIYTALFLSYVIYTLMEYLETGLSIRAWWNNQRMARIHAMNAWFFGFISVILKVHLRCFADFCAWDHRSAAATHGVDHGIPRQATVS
ncbi:hypothetical protein POTOM_047156 [Populus tomentosa]|uniref:Cellulose synthase-like protein H1 n=1 Tax=Populus tomentosa TaxID=118781 RepID=A0A8X7YKE9_POPTO|nr:hypothetical protein POTOM_047156 [Populus tomentosa]